MNAAAFVDHLICQRCTWPHEVCPCVRVAVDVQRLHREVKARHREAVARARATGQRWAKAA